MLIKYAKYIAYLNTDMMTNILPKIAANIMLPSKITFNTIQKMSTAVYVPSNTASELATVAVYSFIINVANEEAISEA